MQRPKIKSQKIESLVRQNTRLAKSLWSGELGPSNLSALKKLTRESGLALASGEILWLSGGWYVTSGGLLRIAKENHCHGIHAHAMSKLSDATNNRWIFKATVYKSPSSKGFVGYGDADPTNTTLVRDKPSERRSLRISGKSNCLDLNDLSEFVLQFSSPQESAAPEAPRPASLSPLLKTANGAPRVWAGPVGPTASAASVRAGSASARKT